MKNETKYTAITSSYWKNNSDIITIQRSTQAATAFVVTHRGAINRIDLLSYPLTNKLLSGERKDTDYYGVFSAFVTPNYLFFGSFGSLGVQFHRVELGWNGEPSGRMNFTVPKLHYSGFSPQTVVQNRNNHMYFYFTSSE